MKLRTSVYVLIVTWWGWMAAWADQRVQLWTEHADIRVVYDPSLQNPIDLGIRDEDHRILYNATNVVLNGAESSRIVLPAGTPFGAAGDSMWILPQSQDPELLYLGFSAEGLPRDVFTQAFRIKLISVDGPGGFAVWQAGSFGRLNVKFNSMDGVNDDDQTSPIIGSHEHFNWGFKAPGVYAVTFVVEGQPEGGALLRSLPATFIFHIHPLPPMTNYAEFAARNWHPSLIAGPGAPDADPDRDGLSNFWEFYAGSDPEIADAQPMLKFSSGDQAGVLKLEYGERDGLADGTGLVLQRSTTLTGPWTNVDGSSEMVVVAGRKLWSYSVESSQAEASEFFRLQSRP